MSTHLNITCSAKFVCVHLGGGMWVPLFSISCPCVSVAVPVCCLSYPGTFCSGSQCRCLLSIAASLLSILICCKVYIKIRLCVEFDLSNFELVNQRYE